MTSRTTNSRSAATLLAALSAAVVLAGCAPAYTGDTYRYHETMRPQSVELGVVESTRLVQIQAPETGVGTVGGAALGGLAGSGVGAGHGNVAAVIGGAILGGVIGNAVERDANRRNGVEVTVRLDNGRTVAIVQQDGGEGFRPGDRVRLVSNGYATRVTR